MRPSCWVSRGFCAENAGSFLLLYILWHELYVASIRGQLGILIILPTFLSASGRGMSCKEQRRASHLCKGKYRVKLQVWKMQQEKVAKTYRNFFLSIPLFLHDMLSERLGFGFEEKSMFKQKAAHTAIWFISQDRCIWQCVLRDTFFPLAMWGIVFTEIWSYFQCNNFFSTFLMGVESYFYSYLWSLFLFLQVKISLFLGCCICVSCTDISKLLYSFMLMKNY